MKNILVIQGGGHPKGSTAQAVKRFTKLCDDVVTYPGSELELTEQISRQTAVLQPQNA